MRLPFSPVRLFNLFSIVLLLSGLASVRADPLLEELTDQNASLIELRLDMAVQLSDLHEVQRHSKALSVRIQADFDDARTTLQTVGFAGNELGRLLIQHRESLPSIRSLTENAQRRAEQIANVGVRRLLHRAEARRIADLDQVVLALESQLTEESSPALRTTMRELLSDRQLLLAKILEDDQVFLTTLQAVGQTEQQLLDSVSAYNDFLDQQLWWTRAAEPTQLLDLLALPSELSELATHSLNSIMRVSGLNRLLYSKLMWLVIVFALVLLWKRRSIREAIQQTATNIGRVRLDSIYCTVRALLLTLVAALPLPMILLTAGWLLTGLSMSANRSYGIDLSLMNIAFLLYAVGFFRWVCVSKGLAEAHFQWSISSVKKARKLLDQFTWVFMPGMILVSLAYAQNPMESGGTVARVGLLLTQSTLAVFLYRLLQVEKGALASWLKQHKGAMLTRLYPAVFWFCVLFPPWMAAEAFAGYVHSALAISLMYLKTLVLIAALGLVYAIARRWLLVVHRTLAYAAALERRKTILAERSARSSGEDTDASTELELDDPVIDLNELSDDTRSVVMIAIIGMGLLGLFIIWSSWFPALRIFDNINLWVQEVKVDGEARLLPTTLADIGFAIFCLAGTAILANRLPSVIEIMLLQRSGISESDRYTISKLFTYTLIATGVLLALNAIGATWTQVQWLVAALGVGIGFGLQEIVANFISGLIILFERPIRIGDVVTVGNTSGVVTRIRIRATTIRDWDRKELLVPNKDLITGRVLNWSLSDEMTRIVITVGVAYGSDIEKAIALMKEAADEHEHALNDPAPLLSFDSFTDNAIKLTMRVYVSTISQRIKTATDLRKAINSKFNLEGINIAYPQRDVHFDTRDPLKVQVEKVLEKPSD